MRLPFGISWYKAKESMDRFDMKFLISSWDNMSEAFHLWSLQREKCYFCTSVKYYNALILSWSIKFINFLY